MRKEDTMKKHSMRRAMRSAMLILPLTWTPSLALGQSQSTRAESFGVSVRTATINQTSTAAVLPSDGGTTAEQTGDVTVASLVTAQDVSAIASGSTDDAYSDAVSSATLGTVRILGGLITADGIVAMATSTGTGTDTEGSTLSNLVVNGVAIANPAANTRVNLPGVGYVVLNEQIPTSGGITINMIHVVLQQSGLTGVVTTGNIIVGSASSVVR
jgi:hypothetical protein